ncbi:hypothetical protein [Nocardia sp. N2S4-5]
MQNATEEDRPEIIERAECLGPVRNQLLDQARKPRFGDVRGTHQQPV